MLVLIIILKERGQIGLWNRNFKRHVIQCSLSQAVLEHQDSAPSVTHDEARQGSSKPPLGMAVAAAGVNWNICQGFDGNMNPITTALERVIVIRIAAADSPFDIKSPAKEMWCFHLIICNFTQAPSRLSKIILLGWGCRCSHSQNNYLLG